MHIFIDESGIFLPLPEDKVWSSVGGLVVPNKSLAKAEHALRALKVSQGIGIDKEFKRDRPDCSSKAFKKFIDRLVDLDCSLHVISTRGSPKEADGMSYHREKTKEGINNYVQMHPAASDYANEVLDMMYKLRDQEYNQCMLQFELMPELISKTLSYYSLEHPDELGWFKWVIDAKGKNETKYEAFFKIIYLSLFSARGVSAPISVLSDESRDYSKFFQTYSTNITGEQIAQNIKEMLGRDISHMTDFIRALDFSSVLEKDFNLKDSKACPGLQMIDLLVSGVNRCLKQNYTDNSGMAIALGKLMINAPFIEEQALRVMGHDATREIEGPVASLLNLMDASSRQLYSAVYRTNTSKRRHAQLTNHV